MKIIQTAIPDLLLFEPKIFGDHRGYFFESYREDLFEKHVGTIRFIQDNQSKSTYGTLRGLHFQRPPFTQSKLVRCIQGEVLDVAVDIRFGSPTYGQSIAVKLNEEKSASVMDSKRICTRFYCIERDRYFCLQVRSLLCT